MGIHNLKWKLQEALFDAESSTAIKLIKLDQSSTPALLSYGTAVPSGDAGYAKGGLFFDTDSAALYMNSGTAASCTFSALLTAATYTLDAAFDAGKVIDGAVSAATAMQVGGTNDQILLYENASNDVRITTSAGSVLTIAPAGDLTLAPTGGDVALTGNLDVSGTLISGTGNAFQVNATGTVTCVGLDYGVNNMVGTGDITVNTDRFTVNATSGNTVVAGSLTVASIVCAGNITGTFIGTWGGTAWAANPTITLSATAGNGLTVNGDTVTTGNAVYVTADASLTTGAYIKCYDSSAAAGAGSAVFTVADLGATTILGSAIGTDALTLSNGDITVTDGNVNITTATAHAGNLVDLTRGNAATAGHAINVSMGTAAVAGAALNISFGNGASTGNGITIAYSGANTGDAINVTMTNTNAAASALVITDGGARASTDALIKITAIAGDEGDVCRITNTASHDHGNVFDITESGTTANAVLGIAYGGANTGDAVRINMGAAVGANALDITGVDARTAPLILVTDAPNNSAPTFDIDITTKHNSGHVFDIDLAATSTHSCNIIDFATAAAYTGDVINILMTNAGAGAQAIVITGVANFTSPLVSLTTAGAAGGNAIYIGSTATNATGHCISISESGTSTNNLVNLAYGGAHTGDAISILMTNAAAGAQGIVFTSAVAHTSPNVSLTSANGAAATLYMSNGSTDAAGHGISILQHGAGANNAVNITYDALSTGDAISVTMTNAAITSQALVIACGAVAHAAVNPVQISSTGFVGATGIALVSISCSTSTLAHANASLTNITFTGTGASAGMGTNLRIVADGATNGGGVSYAAYLSASAAGLEALIVDAGLCRFDESCTFKGINKTFSVPNYVTAGGGPNDITAALTDSDGSSVTLAAGLELYVNMGATTLQAGANNMNLNTGGNVRIYKGTAPTVDKAVISAANSIVHLVYNGTNWLDMSE